jgi:hypothetical protein
MKKLLLLALLTVSQAFAQSPSVSINFTVIGWGQAITGLKYKNGAKFTDFGTIPLFEKSRRFKYTGPSQLQIFNATPAQDKSGKETPVAVAQIPAGMTRAMILIAPQGPNYQCIVIPDDMATIPAGQAMVMNLSPQPLGIRGNTDAPFLLKQRESKLLRPGKQELLQLDVNQQEGTEWKKIRNFFLPLPSTCQTMIFFLKSDSDYFKNIDGRVSKPIQTVVLRNDPQMERAAESPAPGEAPQDAEQSDEEDASQTPTRAAP